MPQRWTARKCVACPPNKTCRHPLPQKPKSSKAAKIKANVVVATKSTSGGSFCHPHPGRGTEATNYKRSTTRSRRSSSDIQVKMEDEEDDDEEVVILLDSGLTGKGQNSKDGIIGRKGHSAKIRAAFQNLQVVRGLLTRTGVLASSLEGNAHLNGLELVVIEAIKKAETEEKIPSSSSSVQKKLRSSPSNGNDDTLDNHFGIQISNVASLASTNETEGSEAEEEYGALGHDQPDNVEDEKLTLSSLEEPEVSDSDDDSCSEISAEVSVPGIERTPHLRRREPAPSNHRENRFGPRVNQPRPYRRRGPAPSNPRIDRGVPYYCQIRECPGSANGPGLMDIYHVREHLYRHARREVIGVLCPLADTVDPLTRRRVAKCPLQKRFIPKSLRSHLSSAHGLKGSNLLKIVKRIEQPKAAVFCYSEPYCYWFHRGQPGEEHLINEKDRFDVQLLRTQFPDLSPP